MPAYTLVLRNDDTGDTVEVASDSVAEGETDEWAVVVDNPSLEASGTKTSGN